MRDASVFLTHVHVFFFVDAAAAALEAKEAPCHTKQAPDLDKTTYLFEIVQ